MEIALVGSHRQRLRRLAEIGGRQGIFGLAGVAAARRQAEDVVERIGRLAEGRLAGAADIHMLVDRKRAGHVDPLQPGARIVRRDVVIIEADDPFELAGRADRLQFFGILLVAPLLDLFKIGVGRAVAVDLVVEPVLPIGGYRLDIQPVGQGIISGRGDAADPLFPIRIAVGVILPRIRRHVIGEVQAECCIFLDVGIGRLDTDDDVAVAARVVDRVIPLDAQGEVRRRLPQQVCAQEPRVEVVDVIAVVEALDGTVAGDARRGDAGEQGVGKRQIGITGYRDPVVAAVGGLELPVEMVERFLRHILDRTAQGILAEQGALRTTQDLDPLGLDHVEQCAVGEALEHAVDVERDRRFVLDRRPHGTDAADRICAERGTGAAAGRHHVGNELGGLNHVGHAAHLEFGAVQRGDRHRNALQHLLAPPRRDDDVGQRGIGLGCGRRLIRARRRWGRRAGGRLLRISGRCHSPGGRRDPHRQTARPGRQRRTSAAGFAPTGRCHPIYRPNHHSTSL